MRQLNLTYFFAQTYFGSLDQIEDDEESDIELQIEPWVLALQQNPANRFQQNIGVFLAWVHPEFQEK